MALWVKQNNRCPLCQQVNIIIKIGRYKERFNRKKFSAVRQEANLMTDTPRSHRLIE
uniref:Transposase n=1 Tax=Parascaris equorum TaxID=6256 RepID=A0A914S7I7_PAREQ